MKLYVVGVGPGDPQLITLKGLKILQRVQTIFYPTGGKETFALSIVEQLIPLREKTLISLHFPMVKGDLSSHWEDLVRLIHLTLNEVGEGAFITLGDPAFYCTFYYLRSKLVEREIELEIIPGISSFSTVSSRFGVPLTLGNEELLIAPAERVVANPDKYSHLKSIVLMKPHKFLSQIIDFAKNNGYKGYVGQRISQKEEKIWDDLERISAETLDYFTLIILKRDE